MNRNAERTRARFARLEAAVVRTQRPAPRRAPHASYINGYAPQARVQRAIGEADEEG